MDDVCVSLPSGRVYHPRLRFEIKKDGLQKECCRWHHHVLRIILLWNRLVFDILLRIRIILNTQNAAVRKTGPLRSFSTKLQMEDHADEHKQPVRDDAREQTADRVTEDRLAGEAVAL